MRTKLLAGWTAAGALALAAGMTGCSTAPVGECLTDNPCYYEGRPTTLRTTRVIRRVAVEPVAEGRCAIEPVGERVYVRPVPRRVYINRGAFDPYVPYGPNSPVSPSQWW